VWDESFAESGYQFYIRKNDGSSAGRGRIATQTVRRRRKVRSGSLKLASRQERQETMALEVVAILATTKIAAGGRLR